MTAVINANNNPSALLRRRLSQAQHFGAGEMDMNTLMSTFNIAFRPDTNAVAAATAAAASMPFVQQNMNAQTGTMNPRAMARNSLFNVPATDLDGLDVAAVAAAQYMSSGNNANSATFGNLAWPAQGITGRQLLPQAGLMRTNSYSSFDSDTYIKSEDPVQPSQLLYDAAVYSTSPETGTPSESADGDKHAVFSTEIDTLMRAIQSKQPETSDPQNSTSASSSASPSIATPPVLTKAPGKKRYQCEVEGCGKAFYQKTHLEIHTRAHTGVKPFVCKEPSCGQRFSQLGNLKTHERRHTGERPYHCDICGKTFAQHGNVRAHKIVHTAAKPFTCKLDNCNKQFTQLGNLKSHQNKFHVETIRRLKQRFENFREGDVVDEWEKEMWEYFGSLYKNCNKGIKGRGKDRRISNTGSMSGTSGIMKSRRDSIVSARSGS